MSEDDLRTELALLRDTVQTGFAHIDHYCELQQAQHLDLRAEMKQLNRREDQRLRPARAPRAAGR